jgi:signal transduction histidine kinase/outer membrane murein-binding lipoprotein Lpp
MLYSRPLFVRGARAVRRRPVTGERDGGEGPVTNGAHVAGGAATVGDGNGGTATLTVPGDPSGVPAAGDPVEAPRPAAARSGSRLALSNWRVRWRILALIVVPTLAAVILGGLRISSGVNSALADKRTQQLAQLNADVVSLTQNMEDERDLTAGYIAKGRPGGADPLHIALTRQQAATDEAEQQVAAQATNIGSGYSQAIRDALTQVKAVISALPQLRDAAAPTAGGGNAPAQAMITDYTNSINTLLTFTSLSASGTSDTTLSRDVIILTALARATDEASQQRATLYSALIAGRFPPQGLNNLVSEGAAQGADQADFTSSASLAQQQLFQNTVSGTGVDQAAFQAQRATATSGANGSVSIGIANNNAAAQSWFGNETFTIQQMRKVESNLITGIISRAQSLQTSATRSAVIISIITLILLILVLLVTTLVARSMIRPLRRLREDALDIAGTRLPDMVRRLSETEGSDESVEIEPIAVASTDEIGEVARAFDQVHREAVRLAADEAMLRGNLNAMFVNLSRRSQSLIERQISLIDSLEQGEQDSNRLSSLFRLDHLATRMRRNSENLLVLAGHEASRRWSQPVPLVDVLRAAISEIEQYERVVLNVQPGISVVGQAVNDVVHLVAELVENATTFSPEDTQVFVSGQPLTTGGVLLDVTDGGVGISDQEMGHANWRLDNPPVVDVGVSRRMGLFVVGRLAARHGVRVRLRHASSGGLTALVWLPDTVAQQEGAPLGRLRPFGVEDYGPTPSLSAPTAAGGTATALPTRQAGAQLPQPGGLPQPGAAPGGAAAQAAAAARIPRFSPPTPNPSPQPRQGSGPQPLPTRPANGAGAARGFNSPGAPASPPAQPGGPATGSFGGFTQPGTPSVSPSGAGPGGFGASGTGPVPAVPSAPANGNGNGANGNGANGTNGDVRVPAPENGHEQRLPIFDSLESDWFRRGGSTQAATAPAASGTGAQPAQPEWHSPADEGWRAAESVAAPTTGTTTSAGLPRRVPRANLVPGSVGEPSAAAAAGSDNTGGGPARSAEEVRNRLASFQRGVREARAAAPKTEEP